MTPSELVQHPEVEGAIDRLADRIRSNGGISIPREAIADLLATLLTVLRESEGPVWLDLLDATRDAQVDPDIAVVSWADLARVRDAFQGQAAERVGALEVRIAEMSVAIADVKAKEECRPLAISSTSLRTAVQNLYRFVEAPR